jgi:hypothetical protein
MCELTWRLHTEACVCGAWQLQSSVTTTSISGVLLLCWSATLQVGVLGWSTASTAATAPSVGKLKFLPETAAVQRCLAELKARHKDLNYIIGLSHAGTANQNVCYGFKAKICMLELPTCKPLLTEQCSAAAELRAQHKDLNYVVGLSHAGTAHLYARISKHSACMLELPMYWLLSSCFNVDSSAALIG